MLSFQSISTTEDVFRNKQLTKILDKIPTSQSIFMAMTTRALTYTIGPDLPKSRRFA